MAAPRSTRASAAVDRLKERSGSKSWSMARTAEGLFFISERPGDAPLCAPLELDDFVAFVNQLGPQKLKKISKLDVEFEKQLNKKKTS